MTLPDGAASDEAVPDAAGPEKAGPVSGADQAVMKANLDDYVRNTASDDQLSEGADPPENPDS